MNKALFFDIEIEKIIPLDGGDLHQYHPLGISVAATLSLAGGKESPPRLWYGEGRPNGEPFPKMPRAQVQVLVRYLERMMNDGYPIVTWNGLSFDFRTLSVESGFHQECARLALGHVDLMFQFFCHFGYAIGLQACAEGFGLPGKTAGMSGAQAPILWKDGQYERVKEYVAQDVRTLEGVFWFIQKTESFQWADKFHRHHHTALPGGRLLTVAECLKLPPAIPPSWIRDPWPREKFTAWLNEGGM